MCFDYLIPWPNYDQLLTNATCARFDILKRCFRFMGWTFHATKSGLDLINAIALKFAVEILKILLNNIDGMKLRIGWCIKTITRVELWNNFWKMFLNSNTLSIAVQTLFIKHKTLYVYIIIRHWYGLIRFFSCHRPGTFSCFVNTMAADFQARQGARTSSTFVRTQFFGFIIRRVKAI